MVANVYAVVGDPGSDRTAVALDLAGALGSRNDEVALLELDPGPPDLVSVLDLSLEFVGRPTVETVLANGEGADGAVTRVAVEAADATLGLIPTPGERDLGRAVPVEGLADAVEALSGEYDVVVLDVDDAGVSTLDAVAAVATEAIVTTGPDEGDVERAGTTVDRLDGAPVAVGGLVLTGCESEARGWRAKARLDPEVLATFPPRERATREERDDALETLVDNLLVGGGIFTDIGGDAGGRIRSIVAALDAGATASITESADPAGRPDGEERPGGREGVTADDDADGGSTPPDEGGRGGEPTADPGGEPSEARDRDEATGFEFETVPATGEPADEPGDPPEDEAADEQGDLPEDDAAADDPGGEDAGADAVAGNERATRRGAGPGGDSRREGEAGAAGTAGGAVQSDHAGGYGEREDAPGDPPPDEADEPPETEPDEAPDAGPGDVRDREAGEAEDAGVEGRDLPTDGDLVDRISNILEGGVDEDDEDDGGGTEREGGDRDGGG